MFMQKVSDLFKKAVDVSRLSTIAPTSRTPSTAGKQTVADVVAWIRKQIKDSPKPPWLAPSSLVSR